MKVICTAVIRIEEFKKDLVLHSGDYAAIMLECTMYRYSSIADCRVLHNHRKLIIYFSVDALMKRK